MGTYVLKADSFHQTTNKPGDPFTYKTFSQGDTVTIEDDERARELIDAGALESPEKTKARKAAERKSEQGPQVPGDSEPPKGELGEDDQSPAGSLASPNDPDTEGAGVVMNTTSDANTQANSGETARGTTPRTRKQ